MEKYLNPEEINITNIFKESNYVIPIYQRSYAWGKDQIEQLIQDIKDSSNNVKYYLGSLIVDKVTPRLYSVIDGQQRLTTIYLLLSYLDSSLLSTRLTFEARDTSNKTLEAYRNRTNEDDASLYSPEIVNGWNVISKYFQEKVKKDKTCKEDLIQKLTNIFIIRTQVPEKIDLNHYFEIMNTRGEQLEIQEIAKGRLLGAIEKKDYREKASIIWDACSNMSKYVQMNFNTKSRIQIFGNDWDEFIPDNFEKLFGMISIDEQDKEKKFSLLEQIENDNYIEIDSNSDNNSEEDERFESITTFPNFLLLVNEVLGSDDENDESLDDKKFINSLQKYWIDKDNQKACDFIYYMIKLRFLFDTCFVKREYAKDYKEDGKWSLKKLKKYTYEKKDKPDYINLDDGEEKGKNLRNLQACLRITYTSPKTMHWISRGLQELLNNNYCDLQNLLEKYCCNKVKEANYLTATGFGIDRIVFTYLDYLIVRDEKKSGIYSDFQFQFRNSIEHFYPQHPDKSQSWSSWEPDYLNDFGNLALITVKANSKFSNSIPTAKVADNPNTIKQSPKLMIMSDLMRENNNEWTKKLAIEHGKNMKKLLENEIRNKLEN